MSQFRTTIKIPSSQLSIHHSHKIFNIGSCFAENIHSKLEYFLFDSYCNPCGIVYNPISISRQIIKTASDQSDWSEAVIIHHNELYHGLHHHGSFSDTSKENALAKMNAELHTSREKLKSANILMITLGSAIVYNHKETNTLVANCHKIPSTAFERKILTVEEIYESVLDMILQLKSKNPSIQFVFTVSPVRYLKEGFTDNTISKSHLQAAIYKLKQNVSDIHYFPACEILLDDLRDYRFYDRDKIHPSAEAIDYIWQYFVDTYFTEETKELTIRLEKYLKGRSHRPLHEDTQAHRLNLESLEKERMDILNLYPGLVDKLK